MINIFDTSCEQSTSWLRLQEHYEQCAQHLKLESLLKDPARFGSFSKLIKLGQGGQELCVDYSKHLITDETFALLIQLANEAKVEEWRSKLISGDAINFTEGRAVLHTALRQVSDMDSGSHQFVSAEGNGGSNGENVLPLVRHELELMKRIAEQVRHGQWKGYSGRSIKNIVNIGIGGSDLGPAMVTEALLAYRGETSQPLDFYFVSNIDGTHLHNVLTKLQPDETLFIIVSKTFTTIETMTNAESAKTWLLKHFNTQAAVKDHFIAISTNQVAIKQFGIDLNNVVKFWDWVGGRYSLWSAVGLVIMIAIGYDGFMDLLRGAKAMDQHFINTPLEHNVPVILALLGIWYRNFWKFDTQAILPYEQYLARFPAYLQQADMESNGKSVQRNGKVVSYPTGPIIWGEPGTNGQHAFYQLLHQGQTIVPVDFIVGVEPVHPLGRHHAMLIANCIAQSEALAMGKPAQKVIDELGDPSSPLVPHKTFPGNRPSTTIVYRPRLDPIVLGALIALYEHKIFVQGIIWGINSFDQWGVELGKQLATTILAEVEAGKVDVKRHDACTNGLLSYFLNSEHNG